MPRIPKSKEEGEEFAKRALEEWKDELIRSNNGAPKACLANGIIALRYHPAWKGILHFDALRQSPILKGILPWNDYLEDRVWEPRDDTDCANWLQHEGIMASSKLACEAINKVSRDQTFHPVLDYLSRCRWDGEPRIDEWLIKYAGTVDTPYCRAVASKWLISAVARVSQPGCKVDTALILEGLQGIGKSRALRALFDPWFADEIPDMGTKEAAYQVAGVWCIELAELNGMRRNDIDRVKAFMSRQHDRYRPIYVGRALDQPRQCVFAGTVNDNEYLADETGGRRWWPVKCHAIDVDGLILARDQIWAEARDRYDAGESWWIDAAEIETAATEAQDARRRRDPWEADISEYIRGRQTISINEILNDLFHIELGERTQLDANRVGSCLKALGWERYQQRVGEERVSRYRPVTR